MEKLQGIIREAIVSLCHRLPHFRGRLAIARIIGQLLTGQKNAAIVSRLNNGYQIKLHLGTPEHQSLYYFRSFDDAYIRTIRKKLDCYGAVFIDIGASVGIYSISVADVVQRNQGMIIAIEPYAGNLAYLYTSIELNQLQCIKVLPIAVADQDGQIGLQLASRAPVGNVIAKPLTVAESAGAVAVVNVYKLDDHPEMIAVDRIDCIKIDIEGYDLLALRGMSELIKKYRPMILAEFNLVCMERIGLSSQDVRNWLASSNYLAYKQDDDGKLSRDDFATVERAWDAFLIPAVMVENYSGA